VIRPLTPADAEELAALYRANRDYLAPFEPTRGDEFFTAADQRRRLAERNADRYRFAIVDDGAIAGTMNVNDILRGALQMGNIGYWVDRERTGRGLATAALAEVIDFAFGELGLHRLEAGTLPDNHASQRVLEKNGFAKFGYARRLLLIQGEWRDHVLFELIADDL
jgi:[ribosomal protein S5]-alanine N-acetyltransferase